jgi:hypothetical protein
MEDLLFKAPERSEEDQFNVSELFQTPILSTGLNRVVHP